MKNEEGERIATFGTDTKMQYLLTHEIAIAL